jgi:hypothetical protein
MRGRQIVEDHGWKLLEEGKSENPRSVPNSPTKIFLGHSFYALTSSIEGVELVKISQSYTLILKIAHSGYTSIL